MPYFGRLNFATVATLGINPSSREFVDADGRELTGLDRRFPTLNSLGLANWSDASSLDITAIVCACDEYFFSNPYDQWFRVLNAVIRPTGTSFYSPDRPAAHLDLVPYATKAKWSDVSSHDQRAILRCGADLLGTLLRESSVTLLVLNGRSVVREFERASGVHLAEERHHDWDLARSGPAIVPGLGYLGAVTRVGTIDIGRVISIIGFNHNLQSSYGVTGKAIRAIGEWIGAESSK